VRKIIALFVMVSLLAVAGCSTVPEDRVFNGRIYNLTSGEVIPFSTHTNRDGKSMVTAGPTASGETFSGEAQSIQNAVQTSSYGSAIASNPGETFSTYVSSSSYSISRPGYQNGAGILIGTKGTVIDVVYQVTYAGSGEGEGKDNKGNHYRLMF
jgi:hypothetical protein